jgi:hypothetical protein
VAFAGDRWRRYVPVMLPWTVCVRDGAPPGSVAVLINRAHRCTDLILEVDAFEDRLLGAIDGTRTLGDVLQSTPGAGADVARAVAFFERLWRYDQMVVDASA